MSHLLHDLRNSFDLHTVSLSKRISATSSKMQPGNPQEPESVLRGRRTGSFARFIKKTCSLSKKENESISLDKASNASTPVYTRPRRNHNPTAEDLNHQAQALQAALDDTWPRRHHSRYRNARALLVCWADGSSSDASIAMNRDSSSSLPGSSPSPSFRLSSGPNEDTLAGVPSVDGMITSRTSIGQDTRPSQGPFIPAAHQLADVLDRRYGIQSQVWMIPSLKSPQDMLVGKVKQFVEEYGGPDNLLIFWYGGHAEFAGALPNEGALGGDRIAGDIIWYGLRDELGISARTISKTLGLARADVLMLNDSPFAQNVYASRICGPGTFELLGSGSTTPSNAEPNPAREGSFTRTLALMLDSPFLAASGVSVLELHRKLLDMMSPSRPSVDTTSTKRTLSSPPISPTNTETERRNTTSTRHRPTSSLIAARAPTAMQGPSYPVYCQISQSTPLEREARRNIVISRLDTSLAAETNYARPVGEPKVKLEIRLQRPYLDVRRWKEWVLRAPTDAEGVTLQFCAQ